ncbi:hypothetical protein [Deinococcus sp. RM]|uniref:hypothetical protein n=1 Tax=Deinococcus sp. RM TaxID=2316359 RepID=UPI003AB518F4
MEPGVTFHAAAWQALWQAWRDLPGRAGPTAAVLTGESGVGKSWLQTQWSRQLRPDQVLSGGAVLHPPGAARRTLPEQTQAQADALDDLARRAGGVCLHLDALDTWPDEDLTRLNLLWHHLTRLGTPALLLGTAQTLPGPLWQGWRATATLTGGPAPLELPLGPLPPDQVEALLRSALRGAPPPELLGWLGGRGDTRAGPLLDAVRQLIQLGGLRREDSTWVYHGGVDALLAQDPSDLTLLAAAAEPEVLGVLATLAVAGRPLGEDEWAARSGGPFVPAQRRAQALRLVRPVTHGTQVVWTLSSPDLSGAVLGQLSLAQVRALHAQALTHESGTGLRALHARRSGQLDLPLTQRAASEALRQGRPAEALEHLQALLDGAPGHRRAPAWGLARARIRWTQGDLRGALALLEGPDLRGAGRGVTLLRAQVLRDLGRLPEAADLFGIAERPAELCLLGLTLRELDRVAEGEAVALQAMRGSTGAAAAYARAVWGRLLFSRGAYDDARREGEVAVRTLRRGGGLPFLRSLMWLAATLDHLGLREEAAACLREAQDEAVRTGDHHARVLVLTSLAVTRLSACDLPEAERAARSSISLCRSRAHLPQLAAAQHNLGMVAWLRGDLRAAAGHFLESWRVGRRAGRAMWALNASAFRALCLALSGDVRLARAVLRDPRAPQAFRTTGVIAAYLHLLTGDPRAALSVLSGWDAPGNAWLQAEGEVVRGHAHARLQEWDAAQRRFEEAARVAQAGGAPPMLAQALMGLGTLRALRGDAGSARTLAAQAQDVARPLGLGGLSNLSRAVHRDASVPLDFPDVPTTGEGRSLRTLGRFTVDVAGEAVPWRGRTTRHLLALLLAGQLGGRPALLTRDGLCVNLWPDVPDAVAYGNLRKSVSRLRSQLGDAASIELSAQGTYRLTLARVDVQAFLNAAQAGDDQEILRLYGGPFLPGEDQPDVILLRLHLHGLWRAATLRRAATLPAAQTLEVLWPLLLDDPTDEDAAPLTAHALRTLPDRAASLEWLRRWRTILDAENAPYPQDLLLLGRLLSAAD